MSLPTDREQLLIAFDRIDEPALQALAVAQVIEIMKAAERRRHAERREQRSEKTAA